MDADADYSSFVTPAKTSGLLNALFSLRTHLATSLFTSQVYYHLIEAAFFLLIIYLVFTRAYRPWARNSSPSLSAAEKAARLAAWTPAPLAPPSSTSSNQRLTSNRDDNTPHPHPLSVQSNSSSSLAEADASLDLEIEDGGAGTVVKLRDHGELSNFATTNFLGLLKDKRVEVAALDVMKDYGCGACGPRGFYGTTEVHLECEAALATFCDTSSAILYSFGAATASSTIPAFVKRGDLLVVDDAISYPLRAGARLSRARVVPFRHNDMGDLRRVLQTAVDEEGPQVALTQRRLILVEGISTTCGDVCPLDQVVKLKDEFKFRLLVDESFSLGVLGMSGKGALQEFHVSRDDVEFATADLGNAFATVGGFCVGREDVVDHQRLSGAGYCFSASQPPFLAKAATTAIHTLMKEGESLIAGLRARIAIFHDALKSKSNAKALRDSGWEFGSDHRSPVVIFSRTENDLDLHAFLRIHRRCMENGVLLAPPLTSPDDPLSLPPRSSGCVYGKPMIKLAISAAHSDAQLQNAADIVSKVLLDELCA